MASVIPETLGFARLCAFKDASGVTSRPQDRSGRGQAPVCRYVAEFSWARLLVSRFVFIAGPGCRGCRAISLFKSDYLASLLFFILCSASRAREGKNHATSATGGLSHSRIIT